MISSAECRNGGADVAGRRTPRGSCRGRRSWPTREAVPVEEREPTVCSERSEREEPEEERGPGGCRARRRCAARRAPACVAPGAPSRRGCVSRGGRCRRLGGRRSPLLQRRRRTSSSRPGSPWPCPRGTLAGQQSWKYFASVSYIVGDAQSVYSIRPSSGHLLATRRHLAQERIAGRRRRPGDGRDLLLPRTSAVCGLGRGDDVVEPAAAATSGYFVFAEMCHGPEVAPTPPVLPARPGGMLITPAFVAEAGLDDRRVPVAAHAEHALALGELGRGLVVPGRCSRC